jgi:hypothetical protein
MGAGARKVTGRIAGKAMSTGTVEKQAAGGIWFEHRNERHRIVMVEYVNRKPANVITEEHWDHTRMPWFNPELDKPRGTCPQYWDFEWSKSYGHSFYHNSGGGGDFRVCVCPFVQRSPPPGELWVAEGIPILKYAGDGSTLPVDGDEELLRMGYRVLRRPRLLIGPYGKKSRNPFDVSEEGECLYCKICDDWLLVDAYPGPCEHLDWCEKCAMWVYVRGGKFVDGGSGRCRHRNRRD